MTIPSSVKIQSYEIMATETCDINCIYCFNKNHELSHQTKIMPESKIPDLLNFIEQTKDANICIVFTGGEPTLNMPFIRHLVKEIDNRYYPNVAYSINTNLVNTSKDDIKFLAEHRFTVEASLDGCRETHNRNRQDWDKVVSNIVYFNSLAIDIGIKPANIVYVVNDASDPIEKNYRFLKSLGNKIGIWINFKKNWNQNEIKSMATSILNVCNNIKTCGHCNYNPNNYVAIDTDGKLYHCTRLMCDETCYGSIAEGYINDVAISRMTKLTRDKYNECKTCEIKCNPCFASHHDITGKLDTTNPEYCLLKKILYKGSNT